MYYVNNLKPINWVMKYLYHISSKRRQPFCSIRLSQVQYLSIIYGVILLDSYLTKTTKINACEVQYFQK